jgi:hypothetical protein
MVSVQALINNIVVNFNPKDNYSALNEAANYIKSHNYIISHDMIIAQHFLTGKHPHKKRHLSVSYIYNPEAIGFPPGQKSDWKTSDWNAMRVNTDPKKVAFITDLIKQHTLIHQQIKSGFHPDKLKVIPKAQSVATSTPSASNPSKEPPENIKKEIKQKCNADFPSDYAQQAECVKKQETAWIELNR